MAWRANLAAPDGAEVLAMNSSCPVQAFRYGPHAYGLQYHVEITASTVAEWSNIPESAPVSSAYWVPVRPRD
jgi:GMP synthase-like glutamine amidotransferase